MLKTPLNSVELMQDRSLVMMIWGRVDNGVSIGEMMLIGQVVLNTGNSTILKETTTVVASIVTNNSNYGVAKLKFKFDCVE